ncbi:hypothetical protein PF003_g37710 [Phytophthora fragariae]|nr:hypothetical protein PF003_g37710 [Phytophthora fragariae]
MYLWTKGNPRDGSGLYVWRCSAGSASPPTQWQSELC